MCTFLVMPDRVGLEEVGTRLCRMGTSLSCPRKFFDWYVQETGIVQRWQQWPISVSQKFREQMMRLLAIKLKYFVASCESCVVCWRRLA